MRVKFLDYGLKRMFSRIPIWWNQAITVFKREGPVGFVRRSFRKAYRYVVYMEDPHRLHKMQYGDWIRNIESRYLNEEYMRMLRKKLKKEPKFSIIFPTWNKTPELLKSAVDSVLAQKYSNWELCISDASTENVDVTRRLLNRYSLKYPEKIKYGFLEDPPEINLIENSTNAVEMATGEYLVFMDCDDALSENCLLELAWALQKNKDAAFIYSDFDKIDMRGERFDPSFWPDWSPHTILSQMYTTHVTCYKKDVFHEAGGLRKGTVGAQDWDLVLRVSEMIDRSQIVHIPKILYHWRVYPGSTALSHSGAKDWAYESQKKVLEDWVRRNGESAEVVPSPDQINLRVKFALKDEPLVSIIIPFRDQVDYLRRCVESIQAKTEYENYEILLVDNQSKLSETKEFLDQVGDTCRVIKYDEPFHFGKINNYAADKAGGEHLIFLNNDTSVINEEWLSAMLEYSQRKEVGAVGAKLLYPSGRIQHAGVIVGMGGAAAHAHRMLPGSQTGYNGWLVSVRNVLAVTAACMMVKKELFQKMDGFDEIFDPGYQDVDFCIRLYEEGYWNLYTPYSRLYHYESVTRKKKGVEEHLETDEKNAKKLKKRWSKYVKDDFCGDPFYNPNLSADFEDFRIKTEWYPDWWGKKVGLVV